MAKAAIIGAMYYALTTLLAPISFNAVQLRASEALNMLVYLTPAAIPGLFVGCALANLSSPFGLIDILCGSLATLLSGLVAVKIKNKWLVGLPCVFFNALIVGGVIAYCSSVPFWPAALTVGIGQLISVYLFGMPLLIACEKNSRLSSLFKK